MKVWDHDKFLCFLFFCEIGLYKSNLIKTQKSVWSRHKMRELHTKKNLKRIIKISIKSLDTLEKVENSKNMFIRQEKKIHVWKEKKMVQSII